MSVQYTSMEAYRKMQKKLNDRQKEVLLALKRLKFANNRQLAIYLGREINCITGRVWECRAMGKIKEYKVMVDPTTKVSTIFWRIA